jgi:hypothetical protein
MNAIAHFFKTIALMMIVAYVGLCLTMFNFVWLLVCINALHRDFPLFLINDHKILLMIYSI